MFFWRKCVSALARARKVAAATFCIFSRKHKNTVFRGKKFVIRTTWLATAITLEIETNGLKPVGLPGEGHALRTRSACRKWLTSIRFYKLCFFGVSYPLECDGKGIYSTPRRPARSSLPVLAGGVESEVPAPPMAATKAAASWLARCTTSGGSSACSRSTAGRRFGGGRRNI